MTGKDTPKMLVVDGGTDEPYFVYDDGGVAYHHCDAEYPQTIYCHSRVTPEIMQELVEEERDLWTYLADHKQSIQDWEDGNPSAVDHRDAVANWMAMGIECDYEEEDSDGRTEEQVIYEWLRKNFRFNNGVSYADDPSGEQVYLMAKDMCTSNLERQCLQIFLERNNDYITTEKMAEHKFPLIHGDDIPRLVKATEDFIRSSYTIGNNTMALAAQALQNQRMRRIDQAMQGIPYDK